MGTCDTLWAVLHSSIFFEGFITFLKRKKMAMSLATIKAIALVLLIVQATSLVLCMRQSRLGEGPHSSPASAVIVAEVLKLVICCGVVGWNALFSTPAPSSSSHSHSASHSHSSALLRRFPSWLLGLFQWRDMLHLSAVGGLYAVQNNLLYLALTHLPPAIYQVTYQLKVLTTAGFSVALLRRRLSGVQWASLVLLASGVAIVQLTLEGGLSSQSSHSFGSDENAGFFQNLAGPLLGFIAVCEEIG